ncbi:MAG: hypothetical protein JOZ93_18410, partial [Sinobacteraceae bacterium]|nr:hypothetical protein [Nevskiaceae bacterium]
MGRPKLPAMSRGHLRPYLTLNLNVPISQELLMRIGVPKEIKVHEYRVGLVPA